jgi:sec-independent protein translocase protein TatA
MFGIGSQELMIIFLIAFLIFGAKRLPDLGSSLGRTIRGFKNGMKKEEDNDPNSKVKPDRS